jgi:hypothetical protein
MVVTLAGIVKLVRLLQSRNALPPMLVTLLGIVTLVRLVQLENAEVPMLVTPPGTTMLVRFPSPPAIQPERRQKISLISESKTPN